MPTLLLLRHAKSSRNSDAPSDFLRPLNNRGKKSAVKIGCWIKEHARFPDKIVSSPALRAKNTAQKVAEILAVELIDWQEDIYEATLGDLFRIIQDLPESAQTVLLVGHNPGLENLLVCLSKTPPLSQQNTAEKLFPTAALACLNIATTWTDLAPGCADLEFIVRPRDL